MKLLRIVCVLCIMLMYYQKVIALQHPSAVETQLLVKQMESVLHKLPRRVKELEAEDVIVQLIEDLLATGRKPVISFDGKTGTGKSTIAGLVLKKLKGFKIVHVDDYGMSMGDGSGMRSVNWDSLIKKVERLLRDENIKGLIVEGVGVLYAQKRGQQFDLNIHVTADMDTQMVNLTSRGLSVADAQQQIIGFEQYQNYRGFDPVYDVIVDTSIQPLEGLPDLFSTTESPKVSRAVTSSH